MLKTCGVELNRPSQSFLYACVAQQVEHWTENPGRVGSIPTASTKCS